MTKSSYAKYWLDRQLNRTLKSRYLKKAIVSYLFGPYYFNEYINGSIFTYLFKDYEDRGYKIAIEKVVEATLDEFRKNKSSIIMPEHYQERFQHKGEDRKIIYVKMVIRHGDIDKDVEYTCSAYNLFISKRTFLKYLRKHQEFINKKG